MLLHVLHTYYPPRAIALLFLAFVAGGPLLAQRIVTTIGDAGPGSLREAIADPSTTQIRFDGALAGQTITLTSPLVVTRAMRISGNSASPVTLTGGAGVLDLRNAGTVRLSGLTFDGASATRGGAITATDTRLEVFSCVFRNNVATGAAATDGGGAIALTGGMGFIQDSRFENNRATGMSGSGGAIIAGAGAMLELVRVRFEGNSASRAGGAIEDVSGASTTHSYFAVDFVNNRAGDNPGNGGALHITGPGNVDLYGGRAEGNVAAAEGGALWNGAGRMRVSDMLITSNTANGNSADQGGGGIYNLSGTVVLTGSTRITGNRAPGTSGSGGGILVDAGAMLEAYGTEISGNSASRAGGGIEDNSGSATTLKLAQVRLADNRTGAAPGNGGGLHITGPGNVELHGGTVTGNFAAAEGGGLWNGSGRMLLLGTTVTNNEAAGADADQGGGGVYNNGGRLNIQNRSTISDNRATGASGSGGGVFNAAGGTTEIAFSTIANNLAMRAGGGIEDNGGAGTMLSLYEVTLANNSTGPAPGNGGGLHITGASDARITRSTVSGNTAAKQGGGLWNGTGRMDVSGTSVSGNEASGNEATDGGGGLYNRGGTMVLTGTNSVRNNTATGTSGSGGGIFNAAGGTLQVYGGEIAGNTANRAGGGIEDASGAGTTVELYNLSLVDNIVNNSPGNGGGLHISGAGDITIKNATVSRNTAGSEGGGLWNGTGVMLVNSSQISDNVASGAEADMGGGGIYNNGGTLRVTGATRVTNNAAVGRSGSGGGIFNATGGTTEVIGITMSGNSASRAGGAIEDASNTSLLVRDTRFRENTAASRPGNGGAIHITGTASVTIDQSLFADNYATSEGGGFWNGRGTADVTATRFERNVAAGDDANMGGGAIYSLGGTLNVTDGYFGDNEASGMSGSGGAILLDSTAASTVLNSTFERNDASRAGGAIEDNSRGGTIVAVTNSMFMDNTAGAAPGNGGAIHITGNGNMNVTGGRFLRNVAAREGGALWNGSGVMNVTQVTISGNRAEGAMATQGGGGIFNNGGTMTISRSTIDNNTTTGAMALGGGIHNRTPGTMRIEYSTVSQNASAFNAGGIANAGTLEIVASTIAFNRSANFGGGIGQAPGATTATLRSTIVALNTAPNRGNNVDVAAGAYVSGGYNLIATDDANVFPATTTDREGGAGDVLTLGLQPLSDNGGPTMTHALACGSVAIDAGDPGLTEVDQRGRPLVGRRDIGSFERGETCLDAPQTPAETLAKASFSVFPTVAQGMVTVERELERTDATTATTTFQLVDARGQVVRTLNASSDRFQIDLDGLTPGLYFVQRLGEHGVESQHIQVVR